MLEVKRKRASHSHRTVASTRGSLNETNATVRQMPSVARVSANEPKDFHAKQPVITGECHFKGSMSIDGVLSGQIGGHNSVSLKQKPSSGFASQAELAGEFSFKEMVRVNGHIAGSVYSKSGTIIVDMEAKVDANVDVAVAVIGGTVNGDIIAHERVELGPASRIYGNIRTRSIVIKDGAIFEGVCRMLDGELKAV